MPNVFTARVLGRFVKKVPELKDAINSRRLELEPSKEPPFHMLVRSIIFQQLSGKAARTIHNRMLELVGNLTPELLLATSQEELRSAGLSRQKASYLHNVATAFGKGGILRSYNSLDALKRLSSTDIVELFTAIKGVGEWTVHMYLIFSLGRLDVLSPGDLGVRKGVMKLYGLDEMPTPSKVKKLAEKWHPLETVGTCLAWQVLRDE
ncbi:MAG: DNA-3-methyladenine glycosylase family protein [Candidatus Thorarchaeota archaeon]